MRVEAVALAYSSPKLQYEIVGNCMQDCYAIKLRATEYRLIYQATAKRNKLSR